MKTNYNVSINLTELKKHKKIVTTRSNGKHTKGDKFVSFTLWASPPNQYNQSHMVKLSPTLEARQAGLVSEEAKSVIIGNASPFKWEAAKPDKKDKSKKGSNKVSKKGKSKAKA